MLRELLEQVLEKVLEHPGKDKQSNMLRHTLQSGHPSLSLNKFKILGKDFDNKSEKENIRGLIN